MSKEIISANELTAAILREMNAYSEETLQKTKQIVDEVSKEALKAVKSAPSLESLGGTKYKASFYMKNVYNGKSGKRNIVANKEYQLTHLLEYGHAKTNGGRTRAFPHMSDGQKIADTLEERIIDAIK